MPVGTDTGLGRGSRPTVDPCKAPFTATWVYTGKYVEGAEIMEFRLLYSVQLLGASRNNTRASVKHDLRREFHPQLRQLGASHKNLDQFARQNCGPWFEQVPPVPQETIDRMTNEDFRQVVIRCISEKWGRGTFKFVPLVTEELCLRCSIEILFLRPEEPKFIMKSGDLDARVKTVFDALRIPATMDETGGMNPQEDETPFFVLLEDDKLISDISVTTDRSLVLPKQRQVNASDAFLVIHAKIKASHPGTVDQWFG